MGGTGRAPRPREFDKLHGDVEDVVQTVEITSGEVNRCVCVCVCVCGGGVQGHNHVKRGVNCVTTTHMHVSG